MSKYSETLEGFINTRDSVTSELLEHLEDVKYSELSWWRKLFTKSPEKQRQDHLWNRRFIQGLSEYWSEDTKDGR